MDSKCDPVLGFDKQRGAHIALHEISEEPAESRRSGSRSSQADDVEHRPRTADTWLQSDSEESEYETATHSRNVSENKRPQSTLSSVDTDVERAAPVRGLSLPRYHE